MEVEMNTFWMDMKKFETEKDWITGGELKEFANSTPLNPVFQDTFGKGVSSDIAIGDGVKVNIKEAVKHFYCVPPATMRRSTWIYP